MTAVIELTDVPERFEGWLAGRSAVGSAGA
jgi:hypothetical protein